MPYMSTSELQSEHERCRTEAIREFKNTRKMGGADFSIQFLERLEQDIEVGAQSLSSFVFTLTSGAGFSVVS